MLLGAVCLWRPRLVREDGPVEIVSAAGFLLAALIFAAPLVAGRHGLTARRLACLAGLAVFCLLLFLSEVSFGSRAVGTPVPDMYGGGEFDGGHDLVILIWRLLRTAGLPGSLIAIAAAGILAGLLWLSFRRYPRLWSGAAGLLREDRLAAQATIAVALLAGAVLIDLGSGRMLAVLEEMTELFASALLLFAALTELRAWRRRPVQF